MRNMKSTSMLFTVIMAITLVVAACGSPAETPHNESDAPSNTTEMANLTWGTAGSTGAYYIIAAAMANEINNSSDRLNLVVQATKGAGENVPMVDAGEMDFGWSTAGELYNSYKGTGFKEGEEPKENLAGVIAVHYSFGQMMTKKDSGIETYSDLKGKNVCVGTISAEVYDMSMKIMEASGVDPEKDIKAHYLTQSEGCEKLADGDIDATHLMAGIPTAAYTNLVASGDYTLVDADPGILKHLQETTMPYTEVDIIPAGTYTGTNKDINAMKIRANIFCRSDLPDDIVYEFCKQVFENWEAIEQGHAALLNLEKETFCNTCIPLHPGAEKYFKEIGLIK